MNKTVPPGEMAGISFAEGWPQYRVKASHPGGCLSQPETMTGFSDHHESAAVRSGAPVR